MCSDGGGTDGGTGTDGCRIVGLITWRSADVNPVTVLVDALRALCLGGPTVTPVLQALAWIAGLLLATVPAAIRRYRHTTA